MKHSFDPSAAQLVMLSVLGGILVACGFLVLAPHEPSSSLRNAQLAISLALFVIGFPLSLKSQSNFKDGIQNNRWPSEQIETLLAILESPLFRTLSWAFVILSCILMAFGGIHLHHGPHLAWSTAMAALFLSQTLLQLQSAAKLPRPPQPPEDWRTRPLLRSEHWGQL